LSSINEIAHVATSQIIKTSISNRRRCTKWETSECFSAALTLAMMTSLNLILHHRQCYTMMLQIFRAAMSSIQFLECAEFIRLFIKFTSNLDKSLFAFTVSRAKTFCLWIIASKCFRLQKCNQRRSNRTITIFILILRPE
jgi:Tat protein secretion system quality control protein TatD with DNase activity